MYYSLARLPGSAVHAAREMGCLHETTHPCDWVASFRLEIGACIPADAGAGVARSCELLEAVPAVALCIVQNMMNISGQIRKKMR
jgi:hypothetical protein